MYYKSRGVICDHQLDLGPESLAVEMCWRNEPLCWSGNPRGRPGSQATGRAISFGPFRKKFHGLGFRVVAFLYRKQQRKPFPSPRNYTYGSRPGDCIYSQVQLETGMQVGTAHQFTISFTCTKSISTDNCVF